MLLAMEAHYGETQERRQAHKASNDPVIAAERRSKKRAAAQVRHEERRQRSKRAGELRRFALDQVEATREDDEQYSFLFRTPGSLSFTICRYRETEDWEFDGNLGGLDLPWAQARIERLRSSDAGLTPDELQQWRRAKCRQLAAGSDWSSPAWIVPLMPTGYVDGYALFLCEGADAESYPVLEGIYQTVDAATAALRLHGAIDGE